MALFAEGIESIKLACSLVLLVPAIGIMLFGRRRVWLVPIWILTISLIAWLRFALILDPLPGGIGYIAAGALLAALAGVAWKRDALDTDVAATALAATVTGWTWVPCVGREFGDILNNVRDEPASQLLPTLVYLGGLFVPLILIAALGVAIPRLAEWADKRQVRTTGYAIVALVGGLAAVTLFQAG